MIDPRTPCIVGVAQHTVREGFSPEPLALWELVVRAAADDTGQAGKVLAATDSLQIVYCQSWPYDDPVGRLAERLGIDPRHRLYSGIGGTTPQVLVQEAGEAILDGRFDVAILTGAEALDTIRRLKKQGERPTWSYRDPDKKPFPYEAPFHPAEVAHNVFQAWLTFPVFDIARRAHLGIAPEPYRDALGRMLSPMTEVAAANPFAWFRQRRGVDELITPTPDNRLVGYPYTKYMVSIMDVDMAAAVVVVSHEAADRLGIASDRRVYLRGWCYATDPTYLAEHEPLWASPAMKAASTTALAGAGVGVDGVGHFDLYSCFTSALNLSRDALGLPDRDTRGLTVTGGLAFAGGAGSDYVMHSLAAMTEVLRADPGSFGLVSGVGMHMTKHVFGVYSTEPGRGPASARRPDSDAVQRGLGAQPAMTIEPVYAGPATIATYTVAHRRDGAPDWGLLICDTSPGQRAYARVEEPELLAYLEVEECVGAAVELVAGADDVNVVKSVKR
jgi:acetyl-CoA C-acetyltransferase